jgi:hypothetical protein
MKTPRMDEMKHERKPYDAYLESISHEMWIWLTQRLSSFDCLSPPDEKETADITAEFALLVQKRELVVSIFDISNKELSAGFNDTFRANAGKPAPVGWFFRIVRPAPAEVASCSD